MLTFYVTVVTGIGCSNICKVKCFIKQVCIQHCCVCIVVYIVVFTLLYEHCCVCIVVWTFLFTLLYEHCCICIVVCALLCVYVVCKMALHWITSAPCRRAFMSWCLLEFAPALYTVLIYHTVIHYIIQWIIRLFLQK